MKKILCILSLFCLLSIGFTSVSFAQTTPTWNVTLQWTPSASAMLEATNLYIRPELGIIPDGEPAVVLPASANLHTVQLPAGTYYFVVTAYGMASAYNPQESAPSNEVSVTLPPEGNQPDPHSGLTVTVETSSPN
jgi:hypothetical protein